ncbi:MAG: sulfatase-like hydrolase/transferase [Chloroflexota bacterium]
MTQPNILLLFSDEHSFRCMNHVPASAGGEDVHTPNFDKLVSQGTVFNNAYCQMPLCTPSRMCLLTGREVRNAGAWDNKTVLDPSLTTMPKTFAESGYTTALIGKMHFGGNLQFHGFQHRPYGDLLGNTGHQWEPLEAEDRHGMEVRTRDSGLTEIPASKIVDEVICHETVAFAREQRHANPDKPWLICASFSRPHFPLNAPARHFERYWPNGITEPKVPASGDAFDHPMSVGMRKGFMADQISYEDMMRSRAAYFACVTYMDEIIGDLLVRMEADGLLENTIIVYTTDHGEMAGEHGVWWKNGWYEACTHIPMIVSLPEQRYGNMPARSVDTPVGLIDLFPTFCGLSDVTKPDGLDGADLTTVLQDGAEAPDRPIYCDVLTPRWGEGTEFRMIRQGQYKYVAFRDAPPLFFDLENDQAEQHNLVDNATGEAKTMLDQLQKVAADTMDFEAAAQERIETSKTLDDKYPVFPNRHGNQYLMPSGKLVDGDDMLYDPDVLAENPAEIFADWPS